RCFRASFIAARSRSGKLITSRGARALALAARRVHFAFAPLARLLVMTVLPQVGEDPRLFAFLLEAPQRALKALVIMNDDFRHTLLANCDSPKNLALPVGPCNPQPGGHFIGRPPSRCRCRWNTVWPPSGLVLTTTRYPRSAIPSARATSRANASRPPSSLGSFASLSDARWSVGITRTCVGACGFKSRNASIPSPRFTIVAGISPAAILQNTQAPGMVPLLASERLTQLLPELFPGVLVG